MSIKKTLGLTLFSLWLGTTSCALQAKTLAPISGRAITLETLTPTDVLARVKLLSAELRLIRLELGQPSLSPSTIEITNAAPREVYYLGLTLLRKADRLAFEQTQTSGIKPNQIDSSEIKPFHVWKVVDSALKRLQLIKKKLAIHERSFELRQAENVQPSEVIEAIVNVNININHLLQKRFSSSDVFQQVTHAVNTSAQLLATFTGSTPIPLAPPYERRKTPSDVYQRVFTCYQLLQEISQTSGNSVLNYRNNDNTVKVPSDVYDLVSLVVSEIDYFHATHATVKTPAKAYHPGMKIPSDVYQRAGILERQLTELLRLVKEDPHWLNL